MDATPHGQALPPSSKAILSLPGNITLRPNQLGDIDSICHHASNKNIWNNLRNRMPHPYTPADATWWINHCQESINLVRTGPLDPKTNQGSGPAIVTHYGVCINDEVVGSIGLEFGDPVDVYFRTAELGYWLGEEHWGKGVMGKVAPAFMEWTWATFGVLIRVNGSVKEGNVASQRCLEKAGFVYEGRKRRAMVKNGVVLDEIMLGALRPGSEE